MTLLTDEERAAASRIVGGWRRSLSQSGYWEESDPLTVARALLSADAAVRGMREALEKAAAQFEFYGREHRNKAAALPGTATTEPAYRAAHAKAQTSEDFAAMCRAAIEKATKP
jgi:hypothetical protein